MADRLLSAAEVGERLALTTDRVYALVRHSQIPHLRFGRTVRFRAESIDRWLAEQERAPGQGDRVGNPRRTQRRGESIPGALREGPTLPDVGDPPSSREIR